MFTVRREGSKFLPRALVSAVQTTMATTATSLPLCAHQFITAHTNAVPNYMAFSLSHTVRSASIRHLSSGSGSNDSDRDPYGVHFNDGVNNLGSGAMINDEMTEEERAYLNLSEEEHSQDFIEQFAKTWTPEKRKRLVERIQSRQAEKARIGLDQMPDDEEWRRVKQKLLREKEKGDNNDRISQRYETFELEGNSLDEDMLDWMKNAPMGNFPEEEEPLPNFRNIGQKKLNRREAVPLPKEMLHHNNLSLLRQFITPAGQIKNRMQTRLGAKDQRKISKLIKRARAMGLIPHVGNFKVRNNGDIHASDIDQPKDWEITIEEILAKSDLPPRSTVSRST